LFVARARKRGVFLEQFADARKVLGLDGDEEIGGGKDGDEHAAEVSRLPRQHIVT
jgi:hypothetical protein